MISKKLTSIIISFFNDQPNYKDINYFQNIKQNCKPLLKNDWKDFFKVVEEKDLYCIILQVKIDNFDFYEDIILNKIEKSSLFVFWYSTTIIKQNVFCNYLVLTIEKSNFQAYKNFEKNEINNIIIDKIYSNLFEKSEFGKKIKFLGNHSILGLTCFKKQNLIKFNNHINILIENKQ